MNIKDVIKDNTVHFSHLKKGVAYYIINYQNEPYMFSFDISEVGDGTLLAKDKAIYFMKYINKAIKEDRLVKC